jgi:hypothetical protein
MGFKHAINGEKKKSLEKLPNEGISFKGIS